jgi:hypothetical protein
MKRCNKTTYSKKVLSILRNNEGTSLVLVAIIGIIILTGIVILRVSISALWASADKQLNQDQAYQAATSFGESLDKVIKDNKLSLAPYATSTAVQSVISSRDIPGLPNSTIKTEAKGNGVADGDVMIIVTAKVADAEYVYMATYTSTGARKY